MDEDGHILTHNFRPIQPLGDRVILFNIIDNDDNTLDHSQQDKDDIPPDVDDDLPAGKENVLNDSPDNNLDVDPVDNKPNEKSKLESACTTHFISLYLLVAATIVTFVFSDRRNLMN